MRKIPTIFVRDWNGDRSRVLPQINPGCEWVAAGEGRATVKLDGTSCLVRGGKLYRRRELKKGDAPPADFDVVGHDEETGKTIGWIPVDDYGPEDKYHREAFHGEADGTYELLGPKIQGNPEHETKHRLEPHGERLFDTDPPRTFEGLRAFLEPLDVEGIVFHHPDGRMAKIKKRDFGLKRDVAPMGSDASKVT